LTDLGEIDKFVKETRRSYSFKRGRGIVLVRKAGGDDFDGRSNAVGAALVTRKKTGGRGIVLVRKAGGDDFDGRSNAVGAALVTRKKTGGRWSKSKQKYCRFRTLGSRSCNKKSDLVR